MAHRGQEEDKSNCIALLKYRTDSKEMNQNNQMEIQQHSFLQISKMKIIEICEDIISDEITQACNSAQCFGLIDATDVAIIEQMVLCLGFL